jgi:hypothetical protein
MNSYQMVLHRPVETASVFGKFSVPEIIGPTAVVRLEEKRGEGWVWNFGWCGMERRSGV